MSRTMDDADGATAATLNRPDASPSRPQGLYGAPPEGLAEAGSGAVQFSPVVPGSQELEACPVGGLAGMAMLAPPGALERRYALALALTALAPDAPMTVLAAKDLGGARLRKELAGFGCEVEEAAKRHFRICRLRRPAVLAGVDEALAAGGPRRVDAIGLWSQPGVFSWDRIDPGSALLAATLPRLAGKGADLGCGVGYLAGAVLAAPAVTGLTLIDIDRRAVAAARRNVDDPRAAWRWADLQRPDDALSGLDFVVTNPPFHRDGSQDHSLGQAFIRRAAQVLRKGGVLWLVANRHLPYEALLRQLFSSVEIRADKGGYKVLEARR